MVPRRALIGPGSGCAPAGASALAVSRRRPGFAAAAVGIDWVGAGRALAHVARPPTWWAAARAAIVGGSVTATRASRWRDVARECPHCH